MDKILSICFLLFLCTRLVEAVMVFRVFFHCIFSNEESELIEEETTGITKPVTIVNIRGLRTA